MNNKEETVTGRNNPRWLWWIVFIIVVLVGNTVGLIVFLDDWPKRGTFGDMFGLANALFSGLAFAGVIYAILLQKQELSLQRDELRLTRDELKGQKEEMERQNVHLEHQSFRATFFEMIRVHRELLEDLTGGNSTRGRQALRTQYSLFKKGIKNVANSKKLGSETHQYTDNLSVSWTVYFNNLGAIIRLVATQPDSEIRRLFRDLLMSQLDYTEQAFLLYRLHSYQETWEAALNLGMYDDVDQTILANPSHYLLFQRLEP